MISAIRRRPASEIDPGAARQDVMKLVTLIHECVTSGIAREACVVHLSRLPADRMRPHHIRLARAALEPLAHADRARMFELPNHDIVAVWRGPAVTALATSRTAIAHLFDETAEPGPADAVQLLTAGPDTEAETDAYTGLWEELRLPEQSARLLALAEGLLATDQAEATPQIEAPPLDTQALAALEAGLARADVARFARRRQICQRLPDGSFRLRWEKRYLSVEEITESLAPNHAPQADPWLFRRLTRTLDRRMLALLAAPEELKGAGPFALNLNVSSILAPEFLRFDAALPSTLRGHVTIDLLPADILADPSAFVFARDFAQSRGYRLQLRGITADLLAVFHLKQIGLDLMQLRWSPAVASLAAEAVPADAGRIVLSHADTEGAIAWGVACGITLFQGKMAVPERVRPA